MKNPISKEASRGFVVIFSTLLFLISCVALIWWQMFIGRFSAYYTVLTLTVPFLFVYYYLVTLLLKWALDKVKQHSKFISFSGFLISTLLSSFLLSTASGVIRFPEIQLLSIEGFEHRQGIIPGPYWPGLVLCFFVGILVTFVLFRTKGLDKPKAGSSEAKAPTKSLWRR